jgi:tetrapyrrole methylase family protein/MazG family protein
LIEECYEVLEALDEGDNQRLCEELGDLMLQIALHSQIAAEAGEFDIEDVIRGISAKLIYRHPHVFGDVQVKDAQEVSLNWEVLKGEERDKGKSILAGVPKQMPALAASESIQRRAAQVGFDWKEVEGVIEKLAEEAKELKDAVDHGEKVSELGDVLFALVNLARRLDVDAEDALRLANERFRRRFGYMEKLCRKRGISLTSLSLEEMDALWEEAKREIKS